jgi:hypothetical protein
MRDVLGIFLGCYLIAWAGAAALILFWPTPKTESVVETASLRKSYQDVNQINRAGSVNNGCPTVGQLSARKQIERVNEILGTPNERKGLK